MGDFRLGALDERPEDFLRAGAFFAALRLPVAFRGDDFFMLRLDFFFAPAFRAGDRLPPLRADFFLAAM